MALATFINAIFGAAPTVVDVLPAVTGTGAPSTVPFSPGYRAEGNNGGRFVYAKLTLAAPATLVDGTLFVLDKDFKATMLTTAAAAYGQSVGVCRAPAGVLPVGTYGVWLQTAGGALASVVATTPLANTPVETTATAGVAGAPGSATVGSTLINGIALVAANAGAAGSVEVILNGPSIGKTN